MAPPEPEALAAIERGPIDPALALCRGELDRLLDPAPLAAETGWCTLPDGVRYVAVRTQMPGVDAAMVDWWFDWHARDPLRYRVWHPVAHSGNSVDLPAAPGAKAHWGAVHHPVEDVGTGTVHARMAFVPPSELGFSTDALDDPAGDDRLRLGRRRPPPHASLGHGPRFPRGGGRRCLAQSLWLGAAIRPYLPALLPELHRTCAQK
jgi:hypothetical protein